MKRTIRQSGLIFCLLLTSCSGGNSQFADLDDDAKGWEVTPVSSTQTFTWRFTARHATTNWQYFAGGQKVAVVAAYVPQSVEWQQKRQRRGDRNGRGNCCSRSAQLYFPSTYERIDGLGITNG